MDHISSLAIMRQAVQRWAENRSTGLVPNGYGAGVAERLGADAMAVAQELWKDGFWVPVVGGFVLSSRARERSTVVGCEVPAGSGCRLAST